MQVRKRQPHLRPPKRNYYRARYLGKHEDVSKSIHDIGVHVNVRGRVTVRIYYGGHWERSSEPLRYFTEEVMLQDWQLLKEVKI